MSRRLRRVLALLGAGAAAAACWAVLIEPRWLKTTRRTLRIPRLPPELEGLRIGLLSDPHAGRSTPTSVIRRAARRLARECPDLVAVTGDLVERRSADLGRALRALEGLDAPLGVWAVPGNHDRAVLELDAWRRALADHPTLRDVTNRAVVLEHRGRRICVAGVDSLQAGEPRLTLPPAADRDLTLLLAHHPDLVEGISRRGLEVDLVLSGHTHGGQVRLPSIGPLVRKSDVFDEGPRALGDLRLYTTRGVGSALLPLRLGARPEVVVLELVGEE